VRHDITYNEISDIFLRRIALDNPRSGQIAASIWLSEFDEGTLSEAERLNVILPLIKWCAERTILTEELREELLLYYEDYTSGKLQPLLDDTEANAVISDLELCYQMATSS